MLVQAEMERLSRTVGYGPAEPEPLVSEAFPDTFSPSALHSLVRTASGVDGSGDDVVPSSGTQWVYRHVDLGAAAHSPCHLLAFRMFVALEPHGSDGRAAALSRLATFFGDLIAWLELSPLSLRATYFAGLAEFGLAEDVVAKDFWIEFGVPPSQVVPLASRSLWALDRRPGELSGPRSEIFAFHPTLGFIEIGTLVTETSLQSVGHVPRMALPQHVTGIALGVERLEQIRKRLSDIAEVIRPDYLAVFPGAEGLVSTHRSNFAALLKGLHAASLISAELGWQESARRRARWNQLLRYIRAHADSVGFTQNALLDAAEVWLDEKNYESLKSWI